MKLKNIFAMCLGIVACSGTMFVNDVFASNLDTYRSLLEKRSYQIKYVEVTPEARVTNKDNVPMYGKRSMERSQSHFLTNKQVENVIACFGDTRYEEMGYGDFKQCRLEKGKDTYYFVKHNSPTGIDIWGTKKGVVKAVRTNVLAQAMAGDSFGGSAMTRYLNALLPKSKKGKDMPVFRYVDSGWLNSGLSYEDYTTTENGISEAVRYYFNGYNMVKIAAVRYWTNDNGVMEGNKTILKITEFVPTPDKQYLELPAGVQDKTKRKKVKEAE